MTHAVEGVPVTEAVVTGPSLELIQGGKAARSRLTPAQKQLAANNLQMVDQAVRFTHAQGNTWLDEEEAALDAAQGLCEAARTYDHDRGVSFTQYGKHRTRGAIVDGQRYFHKLTGPERHKATAVSQFNNTRARSLDAPLVEGISFTLYDVLAGSEPAVETAAIENLTLERLYQLLAEVLTKRQVHILKLKSLAVGNAAIGSQLGVSERTVRRDFKAAEVVLRAHAEPIQTIFAHGLDQPDQ